MDRSHVILKAESGGGEAQITWGDLLDACHGDAEAASDMEQQLTSNPMPTIMRLIAEAEASGRSET